MPERVVFPGLHPAQRDVVASPARFKVLAAGRRWRKTSLGVQIALKTGMAGGRAWWVGPSYPIATIGWRMAKHVARQIPGADIQEVDKRIAFSSGGEVQVKSADNPDSLRGSGLDGVVIDEAAYVKEDAWTEALRPALTDRLGWAIFLSTPNGRNWFYRLFERAVALAGWARWQFPTWTNPHISAQEIEAARAELGDAVFRQELGAEFLDLTTLKPFHEAWIRYYGMDGEPDRPGGLMVEGGFDPAISQKDTAASSAMVVAGQSRAQDLTRGRVYVLEAVKGHWTAYEQAHKIIEAVERWKLQRIRIEDVAYQRVLGEILEREARIAGVQIHIQTVKPDADKIRRAMAWSPLVEDGTVLFGPGQQGLVASMLAVPDDNTLWDLVDAAGICIRGFPMLTPAAVRLPWTDPAQNARARGYAVRPPLEEPRAPIRRPVPVGQALSLRKRAASYAIRGR